MKKQIDWEKLYIDNIQEIHKWNLQEISLEDFLLLSAKQKIKMISYYKKKSLIDTITEGEYSEIENKFFGRYNLKFKKIL